MQQKLELLNAATIRARLRFGNEGKLRERKNLWAWSGPEFFKENSDLKEEENQPDNENNIGKQWAKNPLPKNLLRTKAHAVNHTSTDGPHQQ